jgi:hypothetical protein
MKISVIIYNLELIYGVYKPVCLTPSAKKKKIRNFAARELSGSCEI